MNDLQSTLFWLRLIQLLIAIPLFALIGQGATHVLTRMMGQPPEQNFIYRLFRLIASPVVKPCRWIAPRFIPDRHLPLAAFSLLLVATAGSCWRSQPPAPDTGWRSPNACSRADGIRSAALVLESGSRLVRPLPARDVAIDFYRRMLEQDPGDSLAFASIGFQYAQLGRKREALAMFDRVTALKPATPKRSSIAGSCCRN